MPSYTNNPLALIALGGNVLIREGERGTAEEQQNNLRAPMEQVARLCASWRILLTHGNGPQVGSLLLQQQACGEVPEMPLEILVAQTQGQIGYLIESNLDAALERSGAAPLPLVSLISYVVVDPEDPAFSNPTKPIGPSYSEDEVTNRQGHYRETAKGWRRVVASPEPVQVVERQEIRRLLDLGFVVICCGGGGIPVFRQGRGFCGVEAVIDKDLVSASLATDVAADLLIIATDERGVFTDYGTTKQAFRRQLTVSEAQALLDQGQFPPGSMGPKVTAALRFVRHGGTRAVICHLDELENGVNGEAGTLILPDDF